MFTGQSAEQERETLKDFAQLVNRGVAYAHCHQRGRHMLDADCHIEDGGHIFHVYFVLNGQNATARAI